MRTAAGVVLRAALTLLLTVVGIAGAASTAFAHATFVTSTPSNGEVLAEAPAEVTVELSEPVSVGAGYFRVLDGEGQRVDTGNMSVNGTTITVSLPDDLPDGGYIATYRVVSADSHPVSGAISFAVGDAAPPQVDSQGTVIGATSDDPVIGVLYPVVRWIGYAGLALLAGALLMVLIDPALRGARPLRMLAWAGFDAALAGTVLGGLLQGPYAAGQGIGSTFDPALLSATLETTVGRTSALRLILLGVLGVLLWEWFVADRDKRVLAWTSAGVVAGIAATHAGSGHSAADSWRWASTAVGAVHLAAVAAWIGGLVLLLFVVLARRGGLDVSERRAITARFSPVAAALVAVIVVTGVAVAWVRVGSWGALLETTYGRLLLAKTALLTLALSAALFSRRVVAAHRDDAGDLRRPVLMEAVAGAAAIAVAAVLVATPPARDTYQVARDTQITFDNGYLAQASLDPARVGSNTLHVYLFDRTSALASIEEAEVTVENEAAQVGPLTVDARYVGQGHFIASGVELPASGSWKVTVTFTEPGFGVVTAEGSIDVG